MQVNNQNNTSSTFGNKRFKKTYILFVLLPFLLIAFYFLFIASDRYASGAGFAVRNMSAQSGTDLLGSVTGLVGSGTSTSDSYIVVKFLESRDLLQSLIDETDFLQIYGNNAIDAISRIPEDLLIEERLKSWKRYIDASFDPSSGIIRFEVQAFQPEEAHLIASKILEQVKVLTNVLSEQARKDSMSYAEQELALAEARLLEARTDLRLFRKNTNSVDLSASAMAQIELLANLEKELIEIKARIEVLKESLNEDAPSIKALERKAEALEFQISEKSGGLKITGQSNELSSLLANQEELQTQKTFAETAYASAMASLEAARMEASRNQRYLAIYTHPSLPEYPIYPKRLLYSLFAFIGLNLLWALGMLIAFSVQDHLMAGWIEEDLNSSSGRFKQKLKKLFKNPYTFFEDSSIRLIQPLKKLFKK
ncbi:MAG: lipopolysaccharide biosynthesis protein [Coraliomargaritaceae bacterium]